MPEHLFDTLIDLMRRGGVVMWPLLILSVVALTLVFERTWFWLRTSSPWALDKLDDMAALLRRRDYDAARALAGRQRSIHAKLVVGLTREPGHPAAAAEAVEQQRRRLERFMPTLSTVITASPMLGILGTVLGLITSFRVLSDAQSIGDPRAVSPAIAEALLTTAAGLGIAIVILFPYNAFRAQIDRTLARWEALIAAAIEPSASREMSRHESPKVAESPSGATSRKADMTPITLENDTTT